MGKWKRKDIPTGHFNILWLRLKFSSEPSNEHDIDNLGDGADGKCALL